MGPRGEPDPPAPPPGPDAPLPRARSRPAGLLRIFALARPEAGRLLLGTVFLAVGSAATLAFPKVVEVIVNGAVTARDVGRIDRAALLMLGLSALQAVAGSLRFQLFTGSGERTVARLRTRLFERLLHQEIGFFDQSRTGELLSRLGNDTQILQNTVSVNVSMLLRNVVSGLGSVLLLLSLSVHLTGLMILVVPPVALGAALFGRRVRRFSKEAQDRLSVAGEVAEESLGGIRTVRAFAQEDAEVARYARAVQSSLQSAMRRITNVALFSGGGALFGGAAIAAVLWMGGRMVVDGELSPGTLTSFLLYTVILAFSLGALTDLWGDFMKASGAAERVFELVDREPLLTPGRAPLPEPVEGRVRFEGVRFAYPSRPDVEVLRGLELELAAGERVALVGPSGAGKSTVASLLLRFYDPDRGTVRLDGADLRGLDPARLRARIAIVSQEPILMSATLAENIRYGRPDATDEEVRAAARSANADPFIRTFPEGYDTPVGERGVQLSGGQKQRVAIARALIRDPRVLILDEATSALDAESEHLVKQALERLMEGRTTLIIAHRLSTVRDADRVAVLDGGQVAEVGSHAALMATDGLYRRLVERQFDGAARPHLAG